MAACRSCSYGEYDIDPANAVTTGNTFIDDEICVRCGWCEGVCPVDAAKVQKPFEGELIVDEEKCSTCGACIDICPCDVLSFPESTGFGQTSAKIARDQQYCISCGACANICPVEAIEVKRTAINYTPTKSKSWTDKLESLKS